MIELSNPSNGDVAIGPLTTPELPQGLLHDLRTPLNQIIGYTDIMTEQAQTDRRPGYLHDLRQIRSACGELDALLTRSQQPAIPTPASPILHSLGRVSDAPNAQLATEAIVTEGQRASRAAQGRILVVDDNDLNRDLMTKRLRGQGHEVQDVNSGREALDAARSLEFDLVLLDIMMPKMNGYEVLHHLKADESLRHIPVIMVSALNDLPSIVKCIEMGADDYLCQPFDPTILRARIGACLEKKREHDSKIQLHEEIRQSYQRLKVADKMRDDLTFMLVHDMRAPLTSVCALIHSLDGVDNLTRAQKDTLDRAIGAGEVLIGMIDNLLGVANPESGSLALPV